jgi:2OG-Fe(II) oxygenase superfamily
MQSDTTIAEAKVWPAHFEAAHMPGSLPMGGVIPMTPIFAFETPATPLILSPEPSLSPQRTDIELGGLLAFMIDDVITSAEADNIVDASEIFGYRDEAPGISTPPGMRMNKAVHWLAEESLLGPVFERISHLLPASIDGGTLYPALSRRINMYRYDANDVFNMHTDGDWPGYGLSPDRRHMVEWPGLRSCMSMLLYLNGPEDGVEGGSTRLYRPDSGWVDVTPRKGSALFFRHGFGPQSVLHEGCRVFGDVSKYVARINVMYAWD